IGSQQLSPVQAPQSWATFSPSVNREAFVNGEIVLVDDEVNAAISMALKSGLDVTGLGPALLPVQPPLLVLNINAEGTYQTLGSGVRNGLEEERRVRTETGLPQQTARAVRPPFKNTVEAAPLNTILSMRGAAANGIYRAAIGRVELVNGTPL